MISSRNATLGSDRTVIEVAHSRSPPCRGVAIGSRASAIARLMGPSEYRTAGEPRSRACPPDPAVTRSAPRTRGGSTSRGRRAPRRPRPSWRRRPRACRSRGSRPGGPPASATYTKPDVDRPDRRRVVVEQPDRGVRRARSPRRPPRPTRGARPPGHVAVAGVEVPAHADGPAVVEPRIAAGLRAAHEEPALAVAQDEVRDDLLVRRVLLGVPAAHEAPLARRPSPAPRRGRRAGRQPALARRRAAARGTTRTCSSGSAHQRGSSRRASRRRSRRSRAAPRIGAVRRLEERRASASMPLSVGAQHGRRPPRRSWRDLGAHRRVAAGQARRVPPARGRQRGRGRPVRSGRIAGARDRLDERDRREQRHVADRGDEAVVARRRPARPGRAPQASASARTSAGSPPPEAFGDHPRPVAEQRRRRRRRSRSSRGRPSGARRRTGCRPRSPRPTSAALVRRDVGDRRPGGEGTAQVARRAEPTQRQAGERRRGEDDQVRPRAARRRAVGARLVEDAGGERAPRPVARRRPGRQRVAGVRRSRARRARATDPPMSPRPRKAIRIAGLSGTAPSCEGARLAARSCPPRDQPGVAGTRGVPCRRPTASGAPPPRVAPRARQPPPARSACCWSTTTASSPSRSPACSRRSPTSRIVGDGDTVAEAREVAKEPLDVVLMDYRLPDGTGRRGHPDHQGPLAVLRASSC